MRASSTVGWTDPSAPVANPIQRRTVEAGIFHFLSRNVITTLPTIWSAVPLTASTTSSPCAGGIATAGAGTRTSAGASRLLTMPVAVAAAAAASNRRPNRAATVV